MTFRSTVANEEEGPFSTFSEAFTHFWTRFTALINGGVAEQVLGWCWIEGTFDDGSKIPLLWEAAKNFAYEVGLLAGKGELQDPVPEVSPSKVEVAFMQAKLDAANWAIGEVAATADELLALIGE